MATYTEIFNLQTDSGLRNKIAVAVMVKAQAVIDSASPTIEQITWAAEALQNPTAKASILLNYVLAANKAATITQILAASDEDIQTKINAAVDVIISGGAV